MPAGAHNFPHQPTRFIGREEELSAVLQLLADANCRLLTIIGPGGVGKTRLAIQSANLSVENFAKGSYFVDLGPVREADQIPTAIADGLNAQLSGRDENHIQLLNFIGEKEILLVLDNFEHLSAGTGFILDLLNSTTHVKILITSREALKLRAEWLYPLTSLPYPPTDYQSDLLAFGAVQLLEESILRISPDFSLEAERQGVIRICQLVEGMPLALEMAAAWANALSCEQIADEIQEGIEILSTDIRDIPERHRSIQAIFDQSWAKLGETERLIFRRLSVFQGGFTHHAAKTIAGASLPVLSSLVNKFILRIEPGERYQMHGLIRQYAQEKLAEIPQEQMTTSEAHCFYFSSFLGDRLPGIFGGEQLSATQEIAVEELNVRASWDWAVMHSLTQQLIESAQALATYWAYKGRYFEINDALEKAKNTLDKLEDSEQTDLARLHVYLVLAWNYLRFGELSSAEQLMKASATIYQRLGIPPIPGDGSDPLIIQAVIASIQGDFDVVIRLANEVIANSENPDHILNRKFGYYLLAGASLAVGQYELAHSQAAQSLALARQVGDIWFASYSLNQIGQASYFLGEYVVARNHVDESYQIRESFNDPEGMALALIHLGNISLLEEYYQDADKNYRRSLEIYAEINDKGGAAAANRGLGDAALGMNELESARQYYLASLRQSAEIHFLPLILSVFIGTGKLLLQAGESHRGLELLTLAVNHPASEFHTKEQARQALVRCPSLPDFDLKGLDGGDLSDQDIDFLVASLLAELPAVELPQLPDPQTGQFAESADQPLIEPLTDRELEVLTLIADGLTNKQIAEQLVISPGTAKWYSSQIYSKMGVSSRTQAIAFARQHRLID